MNSPRADPEVDALRLRSSWLNRPLSNGWCVLGWLAATAVLIGIVRLFGGPDGIDAQESVFSTWAIAHGNLACAYPPGTSLRQGIPLIAPLWPLLSGGVAALFHIGHNVPFPSQHALGPSCSRAVPVIGTWSSRSGAIDDTLRIGYLSWLVLMGGAVALLRTSGRGRCGWEPTTVLILAFMPFVFMPLLDDYHPQDLVAMGLVLSALACARCHRWVFAGVFLGLAATSQQFAVLALAPLVVIVPRNRRIGFVGAAVVAGMLMILPVVVATSGRAINAVVLGSGNTPSIGGTVLWEMQLHGVLLVGASRLLPIALAIALAWWVVGHLGLAVLEPVPLVSLIATSLSLRLVFEQNLFGYYFMALAVALLLLDVIGGRLRVGMVAWLALIALVFNPAPWNFQFREYLPYALMAIALALILLDGLRRLIHWNLIGWLALVALAFFQWPVTELPLKAAWPTWLWQIILVCVGVGLAVGPLLAAIRVREKDRHSLDASRDPQSHPSPVRNPS